MTIRPIRKFTKAEAFVQVKERPELVGNVSAAARAWGCSRDTARRWIAEFTASTGGDGVATGSSTVSIPVSPPSSPWQSDMMTTGAYTAAISLAGIAGYFSICGMLVLFPGLTVLDRMAGARAAIVVMAIAMEIAKLVTVGFLARHWRRIDRLWRIVLIVLVAGLAVINAGGVYSQLVAAHFGDRVATTSSVEIQTATTDALIEVQSNTLADIDRRLNQIDAAVEEATKRGKTNGAIEMIGT